MTAPFSLPLIGCAALLAAFANAQAPSTVMLTPSQNPSNFGQVVTLTATVTSGATGKVTFYDGVAVLGTSTIAASKATFTTALLPSGVRQLRVHYLGDSAYAPSNSGVLTQTVVPQPSLGLKTPVTYTADYAQSVIVTDLNGDGKPDLVVGEAHVGVPGVSIWLGNGDGTFVGTALNSAPGIRYSAAGDFNGDGKMDLALASGELVVLPGNGDGTFGTPWTYPFGLTSVDPDVAVGDFNGDGIPDLAISFLNTVGILLGNGDGTFRTMVSYATTNAYVVVLGDFNGDGNTDIVVGGEEALNFSILLGKGDGTFQPSVTTASPSYTVEIVTDDFNGDGKADLVVGDITSSFIYVYLGNGNGTFQAPVGYPVVSYSSGFAEGGIASGDIDGDGKMDLIVANGTGVRVFLGNGDGTFQSPMDFGVSSLSSSFGFVAVADFNADGRTDVATLSEISQFGVLLGGAGIDLSISLASGTGFTAGQTGATYAITVSDIGTIATSGTVSVVNTLPSGLTATGISGAGWSCALSGLTCTRSDSLAGGAAYPSITITVNIAPGASGNEIDAATVSGGGDQNPANNTATRSTFIRTLPSVTLSSSPNPSVLGAAVALTAFIAAGATGEVTFFDGVNVLGSATMAAGQAVLTTRLLPSGVQRLSAFYSGDANFGPNTSAAYLQTVNAVTINGLLLTSTYTVGFDSQGVASGDFNGDGIPDLVTLDSEEGIVSVLLGNGDGTFRAVTTSLTGSIAFAVVAGDFNRDGKLDLALGEHAGISIMLGNGDGSFQREVVFSGPMLGGLAVLDMNRDGIPDLFAVSNGLSFSVFFGNGDGTFQSPVTTTTGVAAWAILDANGDGISDLAWMTGADGAAVNVSFGNLNGTFQAPVSFTAKSDTPMALVAGDFNGDGKSDIAVIYNYGDEVLLGNGDGTFGAPISSGAGAYDLAVVAGDVNGDGKLDLLYAGYGNPETVALGNGDGTFLPAAVLSGSGVGNAAIADFNGDGKPDVAITQRDSNSMSSMLVFLGLNVSGLYGNSTHTGTFRAGQIGANYYINVTNPGFAASSGTVTVTDTLPPGVTVTAIGSVGWSCVLKTVTCTRSDSLPGGSTYPTITLTVNVSSSIELPLVNNVVSVSLGGVTNVGTDPTAFILPVMVSFNVTPSSSSLDQAVTMTATVPAGDGGNVIFLDGMDVLGASPTAGNQAHFTTSLLQAGVHQLRAFFRSVTIDAGGYSTTTNFTVSATPASNFTPTPTDSTGSQPNGIAVGDFNNDGQADLVTANIGTNTVSVLLGNGDGTFRPHVDYLAGNAPSAVAVGDFNRDGNQDLAVVNPAAGTVSILLGIGDGTFLSLTSFPAGASPSLVAVGDFNGDGQEDLVVSRSISFAIVVLFGNADGTFQPPTAGSGTNGGNVLVVEDLNGDDSADLLAGGGGFYYAYLGNGDGTFRPSPWVGFGTGGLGVGDLNGDGLVDVVMPSGSALAVQTGNGDGTFSGSRTYPVAFLPSSMAIADVNGDGKLDVIGASSASGSLIVLLGNGDGTLQSPLMYSVGASSTGLAVGDFNRDGRTDLAVTHGSAGNIISVLLGLPLGFMTANAGTTPQSTVINTAFTNPLAVTVRDGPSNLLSGVSVTFTAPGSGASGLFSNSTTSITVPSNGSGVAAAPFTANGTTGGPYTVTAVAAGLATVNFSLTNTAPMPPSVPTLAWPANGAIGVSQTGGLRWDAALGAISYDVYFGTSSPPAFVTNTTATTYIPPSLAGTTTYSWFVIARNAVGTTPSETWSFTTQGPPVPLQFYPLTPCRLTDTRASQPFTGAFGPPSLAASSSRAFPILSSACSIPSTAQAYSLNFTVVPSGPLGFLSVWPAGSGYPGVSTLNSTDGSVIANAAIVPAGTSGGITVLASNPTDLIIDIDGYFAPAGMSSLDFFPLTPCRVADTRSAQPFTGAFGPPSLAGTGSRNFPIASSPCLSGSEQAYSLNLTAVPPAPLGFLSVWPQGDAYPGVSTLNSPDGTTLANAALVPAGTGGGITIAAGNPTDLIIDINGTFAAPTAGGLQFYPVTPCRVADTRGSQPFTEAFGPPSLPANVSRNFPIQSSPCGIPSTAQAFALNMTVVPQGPLGFLSTWPTGQPFPGVSTLNSTEGEVIANAAIVPAGTGGAITVVAGNPTDLIIDIVGYFAP